MNRPDAHLQGFCTVPNHVLQVLVGWASRVSHAIHALAQQDADISFLQARFLNEPKFRSGGILIDADVVPLISLVYFSAPYCEYPS